METLLTLTRSEAAESLREARNGGFSVHTIARHAEWVLYGGAHGCFRIRLTNDQAHGRAIARPVERLVVPDSEPTEVPKKS